MSPRGVPIPDVREQLLAAAERVLASAGPHGLTGRAISREAGCAAGMLNLHFGSLNSFLAEFIVREFTARAAALDALREQIGRRTVVDNLTEAALSLAQSSTIGVAQLVGARPDLRSAVADRLSRSHSGVDNLAGRIAGYLSAEVTHGRLRHDTDVQMIALALVSTVHDLLNNHPWSIDAAARTFPRLVRALLRGCLVED